MTKCVRDWWIDATHLMAGDVWRVALSPPIEPAPPSYLERVRLSEKLKLRPNNSPSICRISPQAIATKRVSAALKFLVDKGGGGIAYENTFSQSANWGEGVVICVSAEARSFFGFFSLCA